MPILDPFRLGRRQLLKTFGAAAVTALSLPPTLRQSLAQPVFVAPPFQLGVAAGDPAPDGFVIWTRLAPQPLEPGYGMPAQPVEVDWQVAADDRFRTVVQKGTAVARPELGHAVHVEVAGLEPGRPYWYRFVAGTERSMVGRARTAPAFGAPVDRLRFAVGGCQAYEHGHYTAWRCISDEDDLDFIYHYGDYIYEGGVRSFYFDRHEERTLPTPRPFDGKELYSLDEYRRRYALYKLDPNLQMAHASAAFIPAWDDHEVDNNWVSDRDQDGTPPEVFLLRRIAAAQAYYENLPFRRSAWPLGPAMQIYRRLSFGSLLDLHVLDTRQFRTDQPCGDGFKAPCAGMDADTASVLGAEQEKWLYDGLAASKARWTGLAQQVMLMDMDREPGEEDIRNMDSWDAYRAARTRLLSFLHDRRISNTVVLTGDEHQNWIGEVKLRAGDPESPTVATEFLATSISSGADGGEIRANGAGILAANPHLKLLNDQRGYHLHEVTPKAWTAHVKVLDKVSTPGGTLSTRAVFTVDPKRPGPQPA